MAVYDYLARAGINTTLLGSKLGQCLGSKFFEKTSVVNVSKVIPAGTGYVMFVVNPNEVITRLTNWKMQVIEPTYIVIDSTMEL